MVIVQEIQRCFFVSCLPNENLYSSVRAGAAAPLEVLDTYQDLMGKRIIRDSQVETAAMMLETCGEMTKEEHEGDGWKPKP